MLKAYPAFGIDRKRILNEDSFEERVALLSRSRRPEDRILVSNMAERCSWDGREAILYQREQAQWVSRQTRPGTGGFPPEGELKPEHKPGSKNIQEAAET